MKRTKVISAFSVFFVLTLFSANALCDSKPESSKWKAGVARMVITPEQSMWLAGYAARDHQSEGTLHDLWAKALAIEDAEGNQAVLITTDLLGFPKALSDQIRDQLETELMLSRAQIILSSTHTHSGPVLKDALYDIYPLEEQHINTIEQYSNKLVDQIVALAVEAFRSMELVQIYTHNGVTRFQVNRRNNDASTLNSLTELKGPNDHAVPVIKVVDTQGDLMAVAFGYACHPTVLDGYDYSGDYPGFAQIELEESYPGATALFFMGAGADQNPLPRLTVGLARQYGKELAAAVERVLEEDMRELSPQLSASYSEIELPLNPPPSKEELLEIAQDSLTYIKRWADNMLDKMEKEESFISSYPYPLQVWHMGDQMVVNMGGEVVVEYAIKLKQIFGQDIFVIAYSNDDMAYIPSVTILEEGGYEGLISQMVYGLPSTWKPDIESMIIQEIVRLAEPAGE
jgi:neutral ceramidase